MLAPSSERPAIAQRLHAFSIAMAKIAAAPLRESVKEYVNARSCQPIARASLPQPSRDNDHSVCPRTPFVTLRGFSSLCYVRSCFYFTRRQLQTNKSCGVRTGWVGLNRSLWHQDRVRLRRNLCHRCAGRSHCYRQAKAVLALTQALC